MMNRLVYVLLLFCTAAATQDAAAWGGRSSPPFRLRGCEEDYERLCTAAEHKNVMPILCLEHFENDLSPECKSVLLKHPLIDCVADIWEFCEGVATATPDVGHPHVVRCLKDHADELDDECKAALQLRNVNIKSPPCLPECESDAKALCPGVETGRGLRQCLMSNLDRLSKPCEDQLVNIPPRRMMGGRGGGMGMNRGTGRGVGRGMGNGEGLGMGRGGRGLGQQAGAGQQAEFGQGRRHRNRV